MSDEDEPKPVTLLGRDLRNVPCFRSTFLLSIPSGMAAGFAYFLFTSKTRKAIHVGYFSFFTLTATYWVYCRYNHAVEKFKYDQLQQALTNVNILDGTEQGEEIHKAELKSA